MGFDCQDWRVQRAVTDVVGHRSRRLRRQLFICRSDYDPRQDDWLSERMVANLSETFAEVMGEAPWAKQGMSD